MRCQKQLYKTLDNRSYEKITVLCVCAIKALIYKKVGIQTLIFSRKKKKKKKSLSLLGIIILLTSPSKDFWSVPTGLL